MESMSCENRKETIGGWKPPGQGGEGQGGEERNNRMNLV